MVEGNMCKMFAVSLLYYCISLSRRASGEKDVGKICRANLGACFDSSDERQ